MNTDQPRKLEYRNASKNPRQRTSVFVLLLVIFLPVLLVITFVLIYGYVTIGGF